MDAGAEGEQPLRVPLGRDVERGLLPLPVTAATMTTVSRGNSTSRNVTSSVQMRAVKGVIGS